MFKYADDVTLLHFVHHPREDNLQVEWNNIVNWSNNIVLPLNKAKIFDMNIVTK